MPYATEADLDAGWDANTVNLVSVDDGATQRNPVRIMAAIAAASTQIDSYLGRRYPLPFSPTPDGAALLTSTCADIAIGRLADTAGRMTDIIGKRRDAAIAWLRDVAAGRADVPLATSGGGDAVPGPGITPNEAVMEAPPRLFTRATLRSM